MRGIDTRAHNTYDMLLTSILLPILPPYITSNSIKDKISEIHLLIDINPFINSVISLIYLI